MSAASPLASLPVAGARRVAVRVTPDAERQIRAGHPWVFDRSVRSVGHDGAPGDLAVVFDRARDFLAIGLYDPTSPIRIRILHRGRPTTIDEAWFAGALDAALDRRAPGFPVIDDDGSTLTDAYRLVHGENDGLGGLVVDRYGDHVVIEVFTPAWLPYLGVVVDALRRRLEPRRVVLRLARLVQRTATHGLVDGQVIAGEGTGDAAPSVTFVENGLRFGADLGRGQKTGHFCDQRDNRQTVRDPKRRRHGARRVQLHGRVLGARRCGRSDCGDLGRQKRARAGRSAGEHGCQCVCRRDGRRPPDRRR